MSTIKLENKLTKVENYYRSFIYVNGSETLADFVRRVRQEKKLSTTQVEEQSRRGGRKGVSDAYVSRIENGYIQNVSPEKLTALAFGLSISAEEIFAVARGVKPDETTVADERFISMSLKFSQLKGDDRQAIENLVDVLEREMDRRNAQK